MKHQDGFTLVELAIALMVIGLLIGGVLKGQELIENARTTSFIRQIKAIDTATMIFRNTYGALPGDIRKPTRIPNCSAAICNAPGNGNGKVAYHSDPSAVEEEYNFFPHLTKAGMLKSAAEGLEDVGDGPVGGNNQNNDLVYIATDFDYGIRVGSYIGFSHGGGWSVEWNQNLYVMPALIYDESESLSGYQMLALDTKIDDGKPFTGDVVSGIETGWCPINTTTGEYAPDARAEGCQMAIKAGF